MLSKAKKIFFVGIGGIGISALARILNDQGRKVSGSDLVSSELTESLQKAGIKILIGHREENLAPDTDLVIYSAAVPEDNPELKAAKQINIPRLSYPQALGEFATDYKVIAVAGTNGKTTTTAMIAGILETAGLDPTAIVGSQVLAWNSNARAGRGEFLVLEADEYRRAFLNYPADIAVITNIAADHLDYFKDLDDVKQAFAEFVLRIKLGGTLIYNLADKNSEPVVRRFIGNKKEFQIADFRLQIAGKFNQENAAAAAAVCEVLGVPQVKIKSALANFTGTWRRFEKIGVFQNAEIISDYAHHPAGIEATLQMVAEAYKDKKVLIAFQPHQHNRTKMLFADFVKSFCESRLNNFIIAEIFEVAGREESQDQDISSQDLVRELKKCGKQAAYARDLEDCEKQVRAIAVNYDMIIFMGAGDIYQVANNFAK